MKCPFCKNPGFSINSVLKYSDINVAWVCVKCPNPVTYHSDEKSISIWATYNDCWYSVTYLPNLKKYVVQKESYELGMSSGEVKEEYKYSGSVVAQLPSEEENVTPANVPDKLALWLNFS